MLKSLNSNARFRAGRADALAAVVGGYVFAAGPLMAADQVPLKLDLPVATFKGTPKDLPSSPHLEPLSDKPRADFLVPAGVRNVALGKSVTSSDKPYLGELGQITDGKKGAYDYDVVEFRRGTQWVQVDLPPRAARARARFRRGTQWVQVDLGEPWAIHAIVIWHDHRDLQVMHDVIVQVSNDSEFKTGVTTLFNNDLDNSSGLGVGTDREFFETREGKIIAGKGVAARYVRSYARGSSLTALNSRQEIEVYALPAK